MLLDAVASDLPRGGLIATRAGALPWWRLGEADRPALAAHYQTLTAADRRARFGAALDDAALAERAGRAGLTARIVIGVAGFSSPAGVLELHPLLEPEAEIAFSVTPAERGQGIATGLVRLAVALAAGAGCRRAALAAPEAGPAVLRIAARLGFGDRGSGTAPRFVRELAGSGVRREAATGPAPVAVESDGPGASGRIAPGPSPRDPAEPTSRGDRIDGMVRSRGPNLHHSVEERPLAARPNDRITAVDSVSARALEHPSWMQPEPPPDPERSAPATVRGPQEDPGRPAGALAPAASRSR